MAKEKFVYNIHTLRFEKLESTLRTKVIRGFAYFSAIAVYTIISGYLILNFFDSPKSKMKDRELNRMKDELSLINKDLEFLKAGMANLHERDNGIYRVVLEQEPLDEGIWKAGTGGADKYDEYKNMSDGDLLASVKGKVNTLRYQMKVQTESHQKIIEEFKKSNDRMESVPSIKPVREDNLNKSMQLLSGFGMRMHPILHTLKMHTGMDFGAPAGTPIYATGKGVVEKVEYQNSGYGHNVVLSHGYGYQTLYGHMSEILVQPGQTVLKGQMIGRIGSTGTSTGPHCHYEVIKNGEKINPMHYCLDGLSPSEFQQFVERASQQGASFDYYNEFSGN